jgi:TPR repeat protein
MRNIPTLLFAVFASDFLCANPLEPAHSPAPEKTVPTVPVPDDPEAAFQLGRKLLHGLDGQTKDPQRARGLMEAAAAKGHAGAMAGIGFFYATGLTVPKNEQMAEEWFRKSAMAGNAKGELNLGLLLARNQEPEARVKEGVAWVEKAAAKGDGDAQYFLGDVHYFGRFGHPVDHPKARTLYEQALAQGNIKALNSLGVMFKYGIAGPKDIAKASELFRTGAELGDSKAQANLGMMLGPETPQNQEESLMWLILAERKGDVSASKMLLEVRPAVKESVWAAAQKRAAKFKPKATTPK